MKTFLRTPVTVPNILKVSKMRKFGLGNNRDLRINVKFVFFSWTFYTVHLSSFSLQHEEKRRKNMERKGRERRMVQEVQLKRTDQWYFTICFLMTSCESSTNLLEKIGLPENSAAGAIGDLISLETIRLSDPMSRHLSSLHLRRDMASLTKIGCCLRASHQGTRRKSEVAHLCSPAFLYRTSPEIDEGLYLRRGTSYGLTSCVFHVMPRDLIVLLIINRERRYTSRSREVTG